MRSGEKRRDAAQLAVPARPAHRRLRADSESLAREVTRVKARTPVSQSTYLMPAEWETHEATWLGWPHELTDWPGKFAPIPWAFAEIVRHLSAVERVNLLVENRAAESRVRSILKKSGATLEAITFFQVPTDRGWMRDSGPVAVRGDGGSGTLLNFEFNGWAKYSDHKKDAKVVARANAK